MDLHLPLGAGTINTQEAIKALKLSWYDAPLRLRCLLATAIFCSIAGTCSSGPGKPI